MRDDSLKMTLFEVMLRAGRTGGEMDSGNLAIGMSCVVGEARRRKGKEMRRPSDLDGAS